MKQLLNRFLTKLKFALGPNPSFPIPTQYHSVKNPPPKGKRVFVKSKNGELNIGHLDNDVEDLWVAFEIDIRGRIYKFKIMEPALWKEITE